MLDTVVEAEEDKIQRPELFTDAWWNEELDLIGMALAIFPVGAIAGALAVIGGAVITGRTLRLEGPFYGALIFGLFLSIRSLIMPIGSGPKYGTRKHIVVVFAGISLVILFVSLYGLVGRRHY